ncbi:MAG: NAD-dependent epimerase [Mycobacterium sp.]|nr:NAD-dependent epimerase [Mycobacterium sp.]
MQHFTSLPGWEVLGVSRRPPRNHDPAHWLSLDLADESACNTALSQLADVTHVIYAAVHELPGLSPGWLDESVMERNAAMLRNVMEPLLATADVRHVSLLQGSKAYGLHHPVGRTDARNPLRERHPRVEHPNFYFLQEDYLRAKQHGMAWALTVFRPTVVYGDAIGTNMNLIPVIGAWAALLRDEGRALDFPGRQLSSQLKEAVDADLVARALSWAAESESDAAGVYNLTNGDTFRWQEAWSVIAETFGMQVGSHAPTTLLEELPARQKQWAAMVDRYSLLAPTNIVDLVGYNSLVYADQLLSGHDPTDGPVLNSTIAVRQAGFGECMDTEDMFRKWFQRLQQLRVLPPKV